MIEKTQEMFLGNSADILFFVLEHDGMFICALFHKIFF